MTVATATKPATPRKRRARKAAAPKAVKVVTKTVKAAAPKVTTPKRPSAAKLITPQRYWSDVKTRWAIHEYEITMLISDFAKVNTYVRQFTKWPLRPHRGLFFCIIRIWVHFTTNLCLTHALTRHGKISEITTNSRLMNSTGYATTL